MTLPKLIASDLDGTLIKENTHTVSDKAMSLIREYIDRGGIFVAASGRQLENMRDIFAPVQDEIGYICYSGGLCVYRGEVIYDRHVEPELAEELISEIESTPDCAAMVSVRSKELVSRREPMLLPFLTNSTRAYAYISDELLSVRDGIYKISIFSKDAKIDSERWKEKYGSRCEALVSGRIWMDFIPKGVNKGSAMRALIDRLGIAPEDCTAYGDNENDKHMLNLVGCPIVMSHSTESLRALGRYTTDTVEASLEKILRG